MDEATYCEPEEEQVMDTEDNRAWIKNIRVCDTFGSASCYVLYEDRTHRLRLTNRGTWSADDMDIYWPTRGAAYGALAVAPCPLEDPYARIAALESACKVFAKVINATRVILLPNGQEWGSVSDEERTAFKDAEVEMNLNAIASQYVKEDANAQESQ